MSFSIDGKAALVTGANRGMGREHVRQLLERGATTVYAAMRTPQDLDLPGAQTIRLDITDPASVTAAAEQAGDVALVVNNAGISTYQDLVTGDLDAIRLEMETHYFGTLSVVRAFAPVLQRQGGGAILTTLSALSWFSYQGANAYAAAKSAAWSMTNGIRLELAAQGTQVTGVHVGAVDTDMMKGYDGPMSQPADVVRTALDGLEAGLMEVVVDDWSAAVKASLSRDPREFYTAVAGARE